MSIESEPERIERRFREAGYEKGPNGGWYKTVDLGQTPPDFDYQTFAAPKPPLGITPRHIWLERRIKELSEAITRQFTTEGYQPDLTLILEWAQEIADLCVERTPSPRPGRYE